MWIIGGFLILAFAGIAGIAISAVLISGLPVTQRPDNRLKRRAF